MTRTIPTVEVSLRLLRRNNQYRGTCPKYDRGSICLKFDEGICKHRHGNIYPKHAIPSISLLSRPPQRGTGDRSPASVLRNALQLVPDEGFFSERTAHQGLSIPNSHTGCRRLAPRHSFFAAHRSTCTVVSVIMRDDDLIKYLPPHSTYSL